jgi:hypothetical protein
MTVVPHPPYFSLFPQLKIDVKLRARHFGTIEVMETELQAVLNTLSEHDFQDAIKKWQKRWEWCKHAKGEGAELFRYDDDVIRLQT